MGLLLERVVPERESAREGTIYILSTKAQLSGDVPEARSAEGTICITCAGNHQCQKPDALIPRQVDAGVMHAFFVV